MIANRTQRRGGVTVQVAICLIVIVGVVALNLDGGRMLEERRRVQSTSDAAATAAAGNLYTNYWTNRGADTGKSAQAAAEDVALKNGYPREAVTVNIPPLSGSYAGQVGYVEVIINTKLAASFGSVFTGAPLEVSARAVARGLPLDIGIIALSRTGTGTFTNSAPALAVLNKPIIVNSSSTGAFQQSGIGVVAASRIDVTGTLTNPANALMLARVRTGMVPTLDPLAFLPVPTSGTVQSTSPTVIDGLLPRTLQPGIYRGGIRIRNAASVVMLPGNYILEGGGLQVEDASTLVGLGTMVYNTTSPTYASGPITVSGLGKVVMTAPLSGTYQGINFFQNRAMTQPVSITGLGVTTITGVVYAASAPARLTGGAAANLDILGGAYVVNTMTIGGVGSVTVNLGLNPPRVPDVRIVE
jgi:Putative Flp pilus-assembly TadE/G-like